MFYAPLYSPCYGLAIPQSSFFHHFLHTLPSFLVGDVDEVDARRKAIEIHSEAFAFARGGDYTLPEGIEHFCGLQVLARDGDKAAGGVGMDLYGRHVWNRISTRRFVHVYYPSLSPFQFVVGNSAKGHLVYINPCFVTRPIAVNK